MKINKPATEIKPPRILSLDGLRVVSIVLVLLSHGAGTSGFPLPKAWFTGYLDLGNLGVRAFFVISGFLITDILLREYEQNGKIRMSRFYLKRVLRIFPAYYVFMAVITLLAILNWLPTTNRELLHAWSYTANYQPRYTWTEGQWYIGHTWSLAVEEQFYLLWPGIFTLWGKEGARKSVIGFMLAAPIIRIFYALGSSAFPALSSNSLFLFLSSNEGRSFETVGDALAIGCLLSLLRTWLWTVTAYQKYIRSNFFGLTFLAIAICGILDGAELRAYADSYAFRTVYEFGGITLMNICIAAVIDRYMRFPQLLFGKFLNLPFIVFIGVGSYSIYLWQQLFLYRDGGLWINNFPVNFLGLAACAMLSYFLIERPFLRFRDRLLQS